MSPNDQASEAGSGTTVVERPAPGLARGHYPAPAWVVATLGATIALAGLAWFAWRLIRRAK